MEVWRRYAADESNPKPFMSVERLKQISPNINGLYHIQLSTQISVKQRSNASIKYHQYVYKYTL